MVQTLFKTADSTDAQAIYKMYRSLWILHKPPYNQPSEVTQYASSTEMPREQLSPCSGNTGTKISVQVQHKHGFFSRLLWICNQLNLFVDLKNNYETASVYYMPCAYHTVNYLCAFSTVFVTCIACIRAINSGINWELAQLNGSRQGRQINGKPGGEAKWVRLQQERLLSPRVSCFTCQTNCIFPCLMVCYYVCLLLLLFSNLYQPYNSRNSMTSKEPDILQAWRLAPGSRRLR